MGEVTGANDRIIGLRRSMHLGQNFLRESLGNPNDEQIR
jgi:hypothetical protein